MNDADSAAQQRIDAIFANPAIAARVVDVVVHNKPPGWGRRTQAPYFKEPYGRMMLEVLEKMVATKQDVVFSLERFKGKSLQTIYLMVNQSCRYVLEYYDSEKKWQRFLQCVSIRKERGVGVRISIGQANRDRELIDFKPVFVDPANTNPIWRDKLDKWLEESEVGDEPFHETGLALSVDEIKDLKISFAQLKNVLANISAHSIKAVKIQ